MEKNELLQQPIRFLKGVGEKRAGLFEKIGVSTLGDLLQLYPRRYIDYTTPYDILTAPFDEPCVVQATVFAKLPPTRISGGRTMIRVQAGDEQASLAITFFNNPYGAAALEIGKAYLFYGKVGGSLTRREMTAPSFLPAQGQQAMVPIYPQTEGLTSRVIASCVKNALALVDESQTPLPEPLPPALLARYRLCGKGQALRQIHLPANGDEVAQARRRLIFEELLVLQLGLLGLRGRQRTPTHVSVQADMAAFFKALPFAPTGAQYRAVVEILADMAGPLPMSRLLQGDVGSGKTMVAAAAMFAAARCGYQSAMMAPTELLATQHAATLRAMLAPLGIEVALLTGSVKGSARKATQAAIADGRAPVVVGTHALISEGVEYHNLGLVITDEQHRFGVRQRTLLAQKGAFPHLLVMSATPIPRTLGLIIFGDLDISVLDEMPAGRKPIHTYRVGTDKRARMFGFIGRHVAQGRQAYIVCPAIEEGPLAVQAVTTYCQQVARPLLPGCRVEALHGRLKAAEKTALMEAFRAGDIDVLCSTTVIEVGVDVPNATIMVVENAERFGLSALHQLRGRVGRGAAESFCILVSDAPGQAVQERLVFLCHNSDGFAVARYDMENRGPGDFFGNRQHGLPTLQIADLAADTRVLEAAQKEAEALLAKDPDLAGYPALQGAVARLFGGPKETSFN